ncbi:CAP domain-containing protein [Sphingobacterium deserti]|uniref:SCP-like extracellular n=1 Tax=Sphingobacterium deserti TaxID=1229276 RepID=A0A0B8T7Z0_9SPHI|nr:CAP domain-containing protein [Sphingobacterium deserti]KGE14679.1 SCP-like extracellular [Sphingobacterium deserti]
MRILYVFAMLLIMTGSYAQRKKITVDRAAAKEAYEYLQAFRDNPKKMMRALGVRFDAGKVSKIKLRWNSDLAKAAELRARDMAERNYFDHSSPEGIGPNHYIVKAGYVLNSDWLKKRSANNFESIAANHPTAVDGIKAFIIGKGSPGFMHRKHVLGLDTWNGSLQDIGIGFVRIPEGATYKTYLSVIIAKHDW